MTSTRKRFAVSVLVAVSLGTPDSDAVLRAQSGFGQRLGAIVGRIVDGTTGRPIADARVMLAGTVDWVLSDAEGYFAYLGVRPGTHDLRVSKAGYAPSAFGQLWSGATEPIAYPGQPHPFSRPLVLADGERRTDIVVRMWRYAAIEGRIVDEVGQPLVGVQVQARPRQYAAGRSWINAALPTIGRTDDRGIYRIAELRAGDYQLTVPAISITAPTSGTGVATAAGQTSTSAELARTLHTLERDMATQTALGIGRAHARLGSAWAWSAAGQPLAEFPSSGAVRRAYATTSFGDAGASSMPALVTVSAGQERTGVDITLQPVEVQRVLGRLSNPGGSAAALEVVLRRLGEDEPVAVALSDDGGSFAFLSVPRGTYQAKVVSTPHRGRSWFGPQSDVVTLLQLTTDPWSDQPTMWSQIDVTVADADVEGVQMTLQAAPRLSGRIVFEGVALPPRDLLSGLRLTLEDPSGRLRAAQPTAEIGVDVSTATFRSIGVPPGRYFVRLTGAPAGWELDSVLHNGLDVSTSSFELTRDSATAMTVNLSRRRTELVVSIAPRDDVKDLTLVVFPADSRLWQDYGTSPRHLSTRRMDSGNEAIFQSLAPGTYYVAAIRSDALRSWHSAAFFDVISRTANRVTLTAGATARVVAPRVEVPVR